LPGVGCVISVVVYGQKPDKPAEVLAAMLSASGGVRLHLSDGLQFVGQGECLFSVDAVSRLERLLTTDTVLVLADQTAPRRLELSPDTIVIAGADNRRARKLLQGRENRVVTCGTGLRDTITMSSAERGRLLVCVQRELPTVKGDWIEPFEFVVNIRGCGISTALLAAGTAAVCGCDLSDRTADTGNN